MFTGIITAIGEITEVMPLGDAMSGIKLRIYAGKLELSDVSIGDSIAIQGACMTVVQLTPPYFEVEVSQESLRLTKGLDVPGKVNLEKALRLSDRLGGHLVSGHIDGLGIVTEFRPIGESYLLKILAPVKLAKYLAYKGSIVVNGVSLTINSIQDRGDSNFSSKVEREGKRAATRQYDLRSVVPGNQHSGADHDGPLPLRRFLGADVTAGQYGEEPRSEADKVIRMKWNWNHRSTQPLQASQRQEMGCEVSINLIPHTLSQTTLQSLIVGQQVNLEIDLIARYVERMMTVMPNLQ